MKYISKVLHRKVFKTTWQSRKFRFLIVLTILFSNLFVIVGCSNSSDNNLSSESGYITGSLMDAANSNIIATSESGEYIIPVDSYGRFSTSLPTGVYTLSYRAATSNKLVLTNKTFVVANNVTISIVDADLVPQPQVILVNIPVVSANSAIIEWETDIESDGYLEYGTNELYGVSTFASTDLTTKHRVQLNNLMANTTYHFRVVASRHNLESAKYYTQDYTFTTSE